MGDKRAILIVEDEVDLLETLGDFFSDSFDCVYKAGNGEEAIKVLESHDVDIIMSDINMPNLPGDEMIRKVRGLGILAPIVFLTGKADRELVLMALRMGASDVIDKPSPIGEVMSTIERILDMKRRERELIIAEYLADKSPEALKKQQKMVGLLRVVNEQKKKAGG